MEEEKDEGQNQGEAQDEAGEQQKSKDPKKAVPRLLLVDSDKKTQENVPKVVAAVGLVVDTVEAPEEGINLLQKKGPYAIILADCSNSDGKGVDLLQKARKLVPNATRILASGKMDEKGMMEFINTGEPYRVLAKPFDNKLLLKIIQESLRYFEGNRVSASKLRLMGKLEEEFKKAKGQVQDLREQVSKLKSRLQMILGGIALLVISYATVTGVQIYQEGRMLEDNSVKLGAWILFNNKTAKDTTTNKTWMAVDFRNIEKRAPKSWDEALSWKDKINEKKFGGFDDWRLPTLQEYKETYDPNHTKTAFENREDYKVGYPVAFEDGGGYGYWSSDSTGEENAGYFFFIGGYDKFVPRDYNSPSMSVRLIRGG